jgi:thiosulfate/3-mercaptopyruvate sulfurtransferase
MTGKGGLLVTAETLVAELATEPGPVVLDVRWRLGGPPGIDSYREGHLPGAVFTDLDRDLAAPPGPAGRHPLPDTAAFQAAMRAAGVSRDRPVVVCDGGDSTVAARGWWMLRYYGHGNVRVLDGGYRAWVGAGLAVTTATPAPAPGDFTARPGHMPVLDAAGAQAVARTGLLLDARAGERYRGETEPADLVAGHIPGAVSAPTVGNVNADGTFRDAAELAARFASLGALPDAALPDAALPDAAPQDAALPGAGAGAPGGGAVGAYCGSGVTAAHEVLALALAGIPAALYVGSWSNWVADPARPVATGASRAGSTFH